MSTESGQIKKELQDLVGKDATSDSPAAIAWMAWMAKNYGVRLVKTWAN